MSQTAQIFALFALLPSALSIVLLVRRGQLRVKFALLWMPVVVAMGILTLFPGLLDRFSIFLGVAYPPTVAFVMSTGLLFFVTIHLSWELSRLDERVRVLAEQAALRAIRHHFHDIPSSDANE